jgi:hypothetical protein
MDRYVTICSPTWRLTWEVEIALFLSTIPKAVNSPR